MYYGHYGPLCVECVWGALIYLNYIILNDTLCVECAAFV